MNAQVVDVSTKRVTTARVVVASTVALFFITFWQAAAIVMNDLASRGTATFSVSSGSVAVLGLRFAGSAFTSIPTTDR